MTNDDDHIERAPTETRDIDLTQLGAPQQVRRRVGAAYQRSPAALVTA
jgi:hypothetical protein